MIFSSLKDERKKYFMDCHQIQLLSETEKTWLVVGSKLTNFSFPLLSIPTQRILLIQPYIFSSLLAVHVYCIICINIRTYYSLSLLSV